MANLLKFGFLRRKRVDGLMQHFCSYMFTANYHELCIYAWHVIIYAKTKFHTRQLGNIYTPKLKSWLRPCHVRLRIYIQTTYHSTAPNSIPMMKQQISVAVDIEAIIEMWINTNYTTIEWEQTPYTVNNRVGPTDCVKIVVYCTLQWSGHD